MAVAKALGNARLGTRSLTALLIVALGAAPLAAHAGEAEDRATARDLAKQGLEFEEAGDCGKAIERLERAESLFHAPIHVQHLGHCYAKLGRLVEAAEAYRKLTMETLAPNAPPVFKAAIEEAKIELPKLEPRLAHLTIVPKEAYPALVVSVDGHAVPAAALGVSRAADPGKHTIHATATGFADTDVPVELKEGGAETVTLELTPGVSSVGSGATTTGTAGSAGSAGSSSAGQGGAPLGDDGPSRPFPWKTVGLVTAGVGGVALIVGAIEGLSAKSKFDSLQSSCPDKRCPANYDLAAQQSSVRSASSLANVMLIGGGILVVAGVGMVVLAPKRPADPSVSLNLGPGHVWLTGSF